MSGTLLLVDDDPADAEIFELAARQAGLGAAVTFARSGEEAIELLLSRRLRPSLVLLDLKMPGIDGLEVLERVRADPAARDLTVAVLTSSDLEKDKAAARRLGCDRYFTKPATFSGYLELAASLRTLLPAQ